MNNLNTYFASPEKKCSNGLTLTVPSTTLVAKYDSDSKNGLEATELETAQENGLIEIEDSDTPSAAIVIKKPRPDSKLILQNMEEVLNSVKKKHRQKHRRKKEQKKLAELEANAVAVAIKAMGDGQSPATTIRKSSKKPLREKTEQMAYSDVSLSSAKPKSNRQTPTKKNSPKTVSPNETILKHFSRTPKKDEVEVTKQTANHMPPDKLVATPKKTNAFEVMMNARNKCIGSNTPGKEAPENIDETKGIATAPSVKRKIFLQEWADKKGGAKRKLEEEGRAIYVEKQLENRAKRFKKMLVNGTPETIEKDEQPKENTSKKSTTRKSAKTDQQPKRARGRPRSRRLTSTDSVELPLESNTNTQDPETSEFLSKLSSPTKKRDSLLGYFCKKESPSEAAANKVTETLKTVTVEKEKTETPKRSRRTVAKRAVEEIAVESLSSTQAAADSDPSTPCGRPRRSCAGKARYDYDLQESPTKSEKSSKLPDGSKMAKPSLELAAATTTASEDIIIDLDDSTTNVTPLQTPTKKLAPLFVRSMPKPSPDPALLKARHAFLMSGVPEKLRLEMAKQKQCEQSYEEALELFPKVSHVQQLTAEEQEFAMQTVALQSVKLTKTVQDDNKVVASSNTSRRSKAGKSRVIGTITSCSVKEFRLLAKSTHKTSSITCSPVQQPLLPTLENKRTIIKVWKTDFARFPTYKCYNQMREKYRYFSAIDSAQDTEQVSESLVVTRRTRRSLEAKTKFDPDAEEEKPPPTAPNGELLFTEKYKPLLFEQVLVNLTPVTQLRDFLSNWSAGSSARNSQGIDESFDFANDSNSSQQAACNTVVLLGPGSSGKTSAVFALANEMNFNVLEINAGMKRTGKKLIQELQEATQSHQIRKESHVHGKAQKNLLKMSLNGQKSKTKSSQNVDVDTDSELIKSARKCLILIEDADIVFEQMDAGFTDAIYTLAASSKRPVIIVASNPNCQHLLRLMNQNTINFNAPNALNITKFLAVLALIENCPVSMDDLVSLYLYNQRDLRKTLLELQFYIQSGGDRKRNEVVAAQKKEKPSSSSSSVTFFASPSKRRFSEEPNASLGVENEDILASKEAQEPKSDSRHKYYKHRSLFGFYSVAQNEKSRIPYPVDFRLLHSNLNNVFQSSTKLQALDAAPTTAKGTESKQVAAATKRKSRSPKKVWLNTATAAAQPITTPLDALCDFYENASIATLLGNTPPHGDTPHFADRLVPHLAEDMAHTLVERAIEVNLAANACAYNLFVTPHERYTLVDHLGTVIVRNPRTRALDFEPVLRSICRSEKLRSTLERRSTRFYHYLRTSSANLCSFSTEHFDNACSILFDIGNEGESKSQAVAATLPAS